MATHQEIIESLNSDLALEHGAIMQYIVHAMQLRDTALADQVKRAAREEMWHFEWLAEAIHDRGGEPTLDRADVFVSAAIGDSLGEDVNTEQTALDHYERTLAIVGDSDPDLTALIRRIMDDEVHHKAMFGKLAETVHRDGEEAFAATPLIQPSDFAVIGPTVASEYAAVLQYLFNKYGCGDCEQSETYFELAVDEMRHAGWAVSYVAGMGVPQVAPVPVEQVAWVASASQALERANRLEEAARARYAAESPEAGNPDLRADMERAAFQHGFHRRSLTKLG